MVSKAGWNRFGASFHDFAGSIVVHGVGGWLALAAVLLLGSRNGRIRDGRIISFAPSSIPFLALGAWILIVGWFGFNVMSAQAVEGISGLVAVNSLMAMVGGTLAALVIGRNDPGFIHNGPWPVCCRMCRFRRHASYGFVSGRFSRRCYFRIRVRLVPTSEEAG